MHGVNFVQCNNIFALEILPNLALEISLGDLNTLSAVCTVFMATWQIPAFNVCHVASPSCHRSRTIETNKIYV